MVLASWAYLYMFLKNNLNITLLSVFFYLTILPNVQQKSQNSSFPIGDIHKVKIPCFAYFIHLYVEYICICVIYLWNILSTPNVTLLNLTQSNSKVTSVMLDPVAKWPTHPTHHYHKVYSHF